jgi:putative membrane protein
MAPDHAKSSDELAKDRTDLALDRTLMAASRSLMAWVRTGLSMIGFGFTIYKFLSSEGPGLTARNPVTVGMFLMFLGNLSLLFGAIEYWQTVRRLRRTYHCTYRKYPLILAALLGGLGIVTLVEALLHSLG